MKVCLRLMLLVFLPLMLVACYEAGNSVTDDATPHGKLTAANAVKFVDLSEQQLALLLQENEQMAWVYSNFITEDTEQLAAAANRKYTSLQVKLASEAARFNRVDGIDDETRRKLNILRSSIVIPAPGDAAKAAEQSEIGARLGGMYGKGE